MSSAPLLHRLQATVPAAAAAVDESTVIGRAPSAGIVAAVRYAAEAAVTGAATNTRTLVLRNRGQAGTATTAVATLPLVAGTNLVAYDEAALPLSGTAADLAVAEGDILEWFSDSIGTGLADPGGLATVEINRS